MIVRHIAMLGLVIALMAIDNITVTHVTAWDSFVDKTTPPISQTNPTFPGNDTSCICDPVRYPRPENYNGKWPWDPWNFDYQNIGADKKIESFIRFPRSERTFEAFEAYHKYYLEGM